MAIYLCLGVSTEHVGFKIWILKLPIGAGRVAVAATATRGLGYPNRGSHVPTGVEPGST